MNLREEVLKDLQERYDRSWDNNVPARTPHQKLESMNANELLTVISRVLSPIITQLQGNVK